MHSGNPLRHPDLVRPLPMNVPGTDIPALSTGRSPAVASLRSRSRPHSPLGWRKAAAPEVCRGGRGGHSSLQRLATWVWVWRCCGAGGPPPRVTHRGPLALASSPPRESGQAGRGGGKATLTGKTRLLVTRRV